MRSRCYIDLGGREFKVQSSVPVPMSSNSASLECDCLARQFGNAGGRPYRRPRYSSDMSDAEWAIVRDALPVPGRLEGRGGQPERVVPPADGRRCALPCTLHALLHCPAPDVIMGPTRTSLPS